MKNEEKKYAISVAVVAHDFDGKSLDYLKRLLDSTINQDIHNFEIIIADQSNNEAFLNIINSLAVPDCVDIKYFSSNSSNASENINFAISKCSSEFIKIMFLDDFFHSSSALRKIGEAFAAGGKWIACGQTHWDEMSQIYFNDMMPHWNDQIISGNNTIGNPSVIAFRSDKKLKFDEKLSYLFDTDFYQFLKNTYGDPYLLHEVLISTSANNGGASQSIPSKENFDELLKEELARSYENRFYSCPDCKKRGMSCEIPR